jgi:hypothetical protein
MKSLYEVLNVDLAQEYTKERKLAAVEKMAIDLGTVLEAEVKSAIEAMDIPEADERHHWIQKIGTKAAADLLTIGKVQPENMIAMASLPAADFADCVKVATSKARGLNDATVAAESELNTNTISEALT